MLEKLIVPLAVAVVVPLTLRWIARGSAPQGQPGLLAYSGRARLMAALFFIVPALLFSVLWLLARREGSAEVRVFVVLVVLFPAISLPLVVEFFRVTVRYDAEGIHLASPWSHRRSLRWAEIRTARWRPIVKWLDLSDGQNVIHVSPLLTGLERFAGTCRASLPEGAMAGDWEVSSVLTLMENGRAHELVWGNESPSRLLMQRR